LCVNEKVDHDVAFFLEQDYINGGRALTCEESSREVLLVKFGSILTTADTVLMIF
jgi:hypothetical protein